MDELFDAVQQNNVSRLNELLGTTTVNVNMKNRDGYTMLDRASKLGHAEVVKVLLDHGAKVNLKSHSMTPLLTAAWYGQDKVAELLLSKGADKESFDHSTRTPLIVAAFKGYDKVVKVLLDNGANINKIDYNGDTAIFIAAWHGHDKIVQMLLDRRAKYNTADILIVAAENGRTSVVKLMLNRGANVNSEDKYMQTALITAARGGYEDLVKLLLDRGADVNAMNQFNHTPLGNAAIAGNMKIVDMLIEKGAKVTDEIVREVPGIKAILARRNLEKVKVLSNMNHARNENSHLPEHLYAAIGSYMTGKKGSFEQQNAALNANLKKTQVRRRKSQRKTRRSRK